METLIRIKRCALANRVRLTDKARDEMESDDLDLTDIRESIIERSRDLQNLRSRNPRTRKREHLPIIQSTNLTGIAIYTKGKLTLEGGIETYYLVVSSK